MIVPLYQVDAFTEVLFRGNPAAVCLLKTWLSDRVLQAIAAENNLSETAFVLVSETGSLPLRWFTPTQEIDLCGHATLASAFVLFRTEPTRDKVTFSTKGGELTVTRDNDRLRMEFPSRPPSACEDPAPLVKALGRAPREVLASRDYLAVFESEDEVRALRPDMALLAKLERFAVIATAPGRTADFVSRFFAPKVGVSEDPVTGSAHSTLIPYWAKRLEKKRLHARQISERGGELFCEDCGERVLIAGHAVLYSEGTIALDPPFSSDQ